jgi:uncharacterized protein YqfB (UPF0267 family)
LNFAVVLGGKMFTIQAENTIKSIPEIGLYEDRKYKILSKHETNLIRKKLLESEENRSVVRVLRGEGRREIIEKYIYNSSVFFLYGLKSPHASVQASNLAELLGPTVNFNTQDMLNFLPTLIEELKGQHSRNSPINLSDDVEEKFRKFICESTDMQFVRDFFVSVLHTSGRNRDFNVAKPWISCSYGASKFLVAEKFARCRNTVGDYVLIDYWITRNRKNLVPAYYLTRDIIYRLKSFSIDWYPDHNKEIMMRYGLFPQNIVGYYVYKDNILHSYVINPHYLYRWRDDNSFDIGDRVFIDQSDVKLENADGLFLRIYLADVNGQIGIFQD